MTYALIAMVTLPIEYVMFRLITSVAYAWIWQEPMVVGMEEISESRQDTIFPLPPFLLYLPLYFELAVITSTVVFTFSFLHTYVDRFQHKVVETSKTRQLKKLEEALKDKSLAGSVTLADSEAGRVSLSNRNKENNNVNTY